MSKYKNRTSTLIGRVAFTALLVIVLGISLGVTLAIAVPYFADEAGLDELQDTYAQTAEGDEDSPYPSINWDALLENNPDTVGWVYVPGTNINYPIVAASTDSPSFYLRHDFGGDWSAAGTPYLDAGCNRDFSSFNSIIFGHHLINDTMFSDFANYASEDFFDEHRTIYLLTPRKNLELKAVAVNIVDGNTEEKKLSFADSGEYAEYWRSQLSASELVSEDAPSLPTRSFCFVTCSYQTSNARTLVYAVEVNDASADTEQPLAVSDTN